MKNWVEVLRQMVNTKKILKMFAFVNNHYTLRRTRACYRCYRETLYGIVG
jgi:hypothetical protein